MNSHEKSIILINELKVSKKSVAEILNISYSTVNDKFNLIKSNRFTEKDFIKLCEFANNVNEKAKILKQKN